MHTGTPRTGEPWCLALVPKARADATHLLPGSFPEGDALLHGSGHGAGEFWCGVAQGIIAGGHEGLYARLQIAQPAELADHAPTDLLDHGGNVGVGRRLDREKARLQAYGGTIEVDALKKEDMEMQMHMQGAAKALDKGDRSRMDGAPRVTVCDRLVDVILSDRGADDRMDFGREILRRRHPVAQGDGHRDDPLAGWDPGDNLFNEMRRHLRHASSGTGRTKPPPLATEGHQQLVVAGVTAQAQKAMGQDPAPQIVVKFTFHIRG